MVHRAELEATAVPSDYAAVFERTAPACLLLRPDVPRFSVAAASAAFLDAIGTQRELLPGSSLNAALAAGGVALAERSQRELHAALERAATAGVSARLPLASPDPGGLDDAQSSANVGSASELSPFGEALLTPVRGSDGVHLIALHFRAHIEPERGASGAIENGANAGARVVELARELELTRTELASARAELEGFGYSVSHDLRSPLRAIDGFAQALAQDCGDLLDERALHYVERVQAGARRMSSLLDDLLELSRIQLAPLERTRIDVSDVGRRLAAGLDAEHPGRALTVEVEDGLEVWGDPRLFQLLLAHLLRNAWKFTSKKASAHVHVGRDASSRTPTLFVADDGVGFDMAYAKRLFSPFQRLHRATDYPGNGIGLAIARRIVMRHGGRIWAQAKPDEGACFRFCLEELEARG